MVYKRYSDPLILLDNFLRVGRMDEFINEVIEIHNDELVEEKSWDFFLHKVWEQTYEQYRKEAGLDKAKGETESEEFNLEATINESKTISMGAFQS